MAAAWNKPMAPRRSHKGESRLEKTLKLLNGLSTLIASVIISGAGLILTSEHNEKQLQMTKIREVSTLVGAVAANDPNKARRFSTLSLGLYKVDAMPLLIELLSSSDEDIRKASLASIEVVGKPGLKILKARYVDLSSRRDTTSANARAQLLRAICNVNRGELHLAWQALGDMQEARTVRIEAARLIGVYSRFYSDGIPQLLSSLNAWLAKRDWEGVTVVLSSLCKLDFYHAQHDDLISSLVCGNLEVEKLAVEAAQHSIDPALADDLDVIGYGSESPVKESAKYMAATIHGNIRVTDISDNGHVFGK